MAHNQPALEEISIRHGDVSARIAPMRGGLVTALNVSGREVLYLDNESFSDLTKNVRGGIPVLFPFAGKLENGEFRPSGTKMGQHGFGRNRGWVVFEGTRSMLRMRLEPDDEIRAMYPYDFVVEQTCLVVAEGLQIEMLVLNEDKKPLPVAPGWHPYFNCPADQKNKVETLTTRDVQKRLTNDAEFDFGIVAPADGRAKFDVPELGLLRLTFSPQMRHLQFWSQPGKPFICIEPFTGPANVVNTDKRVDIPPGEARTFWMRIQVED